MKTDSHVSGVGKVVGDILLAKIRKLALLGENEEINSGDDGRSSGEKCQPLRDETVQWKITNLTECYEKAFVYTI